MDIVELNDDIVELNDDIMELNDDKMDLSEDIFHESEEQSHPDIRLSWNYSSCQNVIGSEDVYDYMTDFRVYDELSYIQQEAILCSENLGEDFQVLYVDRSKVPPLEEDFYEYQSIPKLYGIMETVSPEVAVNFLNNGILQIQRSALGLVGRGTVICIVDTGIDYTSPAFIDQNGQTRIQAIWDQTISTGIPPKDFQYGTEYTSDQINLALASENPYDIVPSRDTNGHGTAMATIAAGRTYSTEAYIGAAPEAKLVIVKLKECKQYLRDYYLIPESVPAYQENDIMQGAKYAEGFIELFKRPVILCIGLGTNMGNHAGSGLLSRYLDILSSKRNMVVVVSGGNEGNTAHHFQGNLLENNSSNTGRVSYDSRMQEPYQDVEIRVSEGCKGIFFEMWGNTQDAFNINVISPGGEIIPPVRLGIEKSMTYGFVYEPSTITIDSILVEQASGDELILFRLRDPTPGIWTIRVVPIGAISNGIYNLWLPIEQFLEVPVYFLKSTPYLTLTEPANAKDVITIVY